jgi:hypothetical protein
MPSCRETETASRTRSQHRMHWPPHGGLGDEARTVGNRTRRSMSTGIGIARVLEELGLKPESSGELFHHAKAWCLHPRAEETRPAGDMI